MTKLPVHATVDLTTGMPNPVEANAAGAFHAIYLNGGPIRQALEFERPLNHPDFHLNFVYQLYGKGCVMSEFGWIAIGLAAFIFYVSDRIVRKLSPSSRSVKFIEREGDNDFAVWIYVEHCSLTEFSASYDGNWDAGVVFQMSGEAGINSEAPCQRGTIKVYSTLDVPATTNQIGRGKLHGENVEINIGLSPAHAAVLLNEARLGRGTAHAQGYINDQGQLRLTCFNYTPAARD